jgi:signal transduction histidine kinase
MKSLTQTATPRAIITACTIGLPAIVLLLGLLLAQQTFQNNATAQAVGYSSTVRMHLQRVFSMLQDAETGQRGYLLTGQDKHLAPYTAATRQIGPVMARLAVLLQSDPEQRAKVGRLQNIVARKLAELNQTITLNRAGDHSGAVAIVSAGDGYALMAEARKITSDIQAVQARARDIQIARSTAGYNRTIWFAGVLLGALALLIAFSAIMALINYRAGEKVISDIRTLTEQLQQEKGRLLRTVGELNIAKAAADDANRAKSEFLAGMSHELRTPLNAILGFSEIIKDELFGPVGQHQYADYANDVHKSGQHLLDLINDVLDLSKIQAGKVELREAEVDLSRLVRDAISFTRERARKGGVSLSFDDNASGPVLLADRRLLTQILLNLLSNAIKFTPSGGTVTARTFSDARGIGFSVEDTGIGMSPDDIVKAMSPYGQIDSKVARKHQGTGLGLPISQSLAALHGGNLVVESTPGRGTIITLVLPIFRAVRSLRAAAG